MKKHMGKRHGKKTWDKHMGKIISSALKCFPKKCYRAVALLGPLRENILVKYPESG
ncbi:MAG: hypothetical protein LBE27_03985 [Deltaproteobacteria bacterium]|jgi:hypothetical protein|nr:hypothetical protein [Deltaproteobacteria bacterium]